MGDPSSSKQPQGHKEAAASSSSSSSPAQRQVLFDYRKDDPVRFSVTRNRSQGTPRTAADASASSASQTSSVFTLSSSTTDGSSASSALFDGQQRSESHTVLSNQLKRMYRDITRLEAAVKNDAEEPSEEPSRSMKRSSSSSDDETRKERWAQQLTNHRDLAEHIHDFLSISLSPSLPSSLRGIPEKYNIVARLWSYAFHKLLEALRRASFTSPLALEHLQDFVFFAYRFYCGLVEETALGSFKSAWLEALGDLARYKMAICALVTATQAGTSAALTLDAVKKASTDGASVQPSQTADSVISDQPAARIDDLPALSIGVAAARAMNLDPEPEIWRRTAMEWYASGLAETPGQGKLHHHIGLLLREAEGEELRGIYHFAKSMTSLHSFSTSRESVLPLWSAAAQSKRSTPDARAPDLFVLMQGMIFTNIQLDDFQPTLSRFIERLQLELPSEKEWIMMATVNIASIFEYNRPSSTLRKMGAVGGRSEGLKDGHSSKLVITKKAATPRSPAMAHEDKMDVDEPPKNGQHPPPPSPAQAEPEQIEVEPPLPLKLALQLTFSMLTFVLKHPTLKTNFARTTLNPYLTFILTFLSTILKSPQVCRLIERSVPWEELARFLPLIPKDIMASQNLIGTSAAPAWSMLTSGCAPPLPEDWCMRGMEWPGRKVFAPGYWKSGEDRRVELEVLSQQACLDQTDGRIEDDDGDDEGGAREQQTDTWKRWVRIIRSGVTIAQAVDGFKWVPGTKEWSVEGALGEKVKMWREDDAAQRDEEERRRTRRRWTEDSMDVDENSVAHDDDHSDWSENEADTEEVRELRARRRFLKSLVQESSEQMVSSPPRSSHVRSAPRKASKLQLSAGYTILVVDTNVFLSMLSMVSTLIQSHKWTVVVPLPVIMELDGLSNNNSPELREIAQNAMKFLTANIRTHSSSLKVQTSKGNYLPSLEVRTEEVNFKDGSSAEKSMDDLILKAAIWQDEHWVDRSALLQSESGAVKDGSAVKVALLTLDRNMRLKARSRQLYAATEKELASVLASTT